MHMVMSVLQPVRLRMHMMMTVLLPVRAPLGYHLRFGYHPLRDPLRRMMNWHLHYTSSSLFHLLQCLSQSWMPQR